MEYSDIEKKWSRISLAADENYSSLQLAADISVRLLIAYDRKMKRCLILSMLNAESLDFVNNLREHISFQYFDQSGHVIVTLIDDRFREQFNAFIYSAYLNLKPITIVKDAALILAKTYHKWSDFFSEIIISSLSTEEVMGLWGELFYLKRKMDNTKAELLNDHLKCWVGPFGKTHDFEFPDSDTEIKTKVEEISYVNISSEFQLDTVNGKPLLLHVISVNKNTYYGITLGIIVRDIYEMISSKLGDVSLFLKALSRAGLPWQDIDKYNEHSFSVRVETTYDCLNTRFPKIIRANLASEISNVKYRLNLDSLSDFITDKVKH
ncbi:PD-(D/E)XK motif protein [Limnovirga soli]|uniref:PD-(D/E)XK motif protein n=1 Tax=Limnovirga soli TaxID=2656915 RepID=A0A8J8JSS2_9BACT|nr:PD-(D/E)XK motif protein [Limnovirga soli]NNV57302.1 PD-(D/E)XK motif protein [Limnovirga soli]